MTTVVNYGHPPSLYYLASLRPSRPPANPYPSPILHNDSKLMKNLSQPNLICENKTAPTNTKDFNQDSGLVFFFLSITFFILIKMTWLGRDISTNTHLCLASGRHLTNKNLVQSRAKSDHARM